MVNHDNSPLSSYCEKSSKHTWNTIIAETTKVEINWAENLKSEMKLNMVLL